MTCVSCSRAIDSTSRLCPYCGANPVSGAKIDTTPLVESHFPRKQDMSAPESALEFFRHRQWMVITAVVAILFSIAFFGHRMIREKNEATATEVPAVPLTEVADLSGQSPGADRAPIPELPFQLEGNAKNARMLLVEPGAVAPPPPPVETTTATTTAPPTATTTAARGPVAPAIGPRPAAGPKVLTGPGIRLQTAKPTTLNPQPTTARPQPQRAPTP